MSFLRNLEQRFNERVEELYGRLQAKDSADLHPIIIVRPDDPNRPQGTEGSSRLVPIRRVATDERRITAFLSSPRGVQFLLNQQLLQTGNAISETRILNPLFINLNLTPNEHFKRQLTDQTEISLGSLERSPASTPEVGLAGRLQKSTAAEATSKITGRNYGRNVISLLGSTQLVQTLMGTIGIGEQQGTLGINARPELSIGSDNQYYSVLLRKGFEPFASRELSILAGALGAAGAVGSIFGLPNIFGGLGGNTPNPIPSQTKQMRYGITDDTEAQRYLPSSITIQSPIILRPTSVRINLAGRGVNLLQAGVFASAIAGSATLRRVATGFAAATRNVNTLFSSATQQVSREAPKVSDVVSDLNDRTTRVIADDIRAGGGTPLQDIYDVDRSKSVKSALKEQATLIRRYTDEINTNEVPNRGIVGGITLEKLRSVNADREANQEAFADTVAAQEYFESLEKRPIQPGSDKQAPGYYHDTLNLITRVRNTSGILPRKDEHDVTYPQDYINVTIYDKVNDRLEPFRAILAGISETVSPEFNATQYIGRIERNIVYLGATRELSFTLYVHAWSPKELLAVWDKVNFVTGLAYPAGVSGDGYLLPPIVELTIGDFYKAQPGYFTAINHTIEDDASWEIERLDNDEEKSAQVPKTIQMQLTFAVIEKDSMVSSSPFYGFGVPLTA
ncbi:hypothetical protein LCGC14_1004080 [marine sediment metagenome]|uniref:Uncharacterized protein n=1 Tax=marine sediment metagenome TaxID=412755 RepID=A0A0F9N270_9ZZZZ